MRAESNTALGQFLIKNRYLLLVLLAGLVLILLPGGSNSDGEAGTSTAAEQRLRDALLRMEGAGEVYVLLAEESGRNGGYTGAIILCQGADTAAVRLQIVEMVSAFTGLGSNRIMVLKMKS